MRLNNKIAVITGAGGDIGKAIADRFSEEGAIVIASDIGLDAGKSTIESLVENRAEAQICQLYTSPSPRDKRQYRMRSSA